MRGARGAGASAGSMPRWEACGSAGGRGLSPTRRPRGAPPPPPTPTAGNRWERPPKRSLWLVAPRLGKAAPPPPSVARGRGAAGGGRPSGVSTQQRLHTGVLAGARRSRRSPVCVRVRECACACVRGATPHSHCVLGKDKSAPVRKVPQAACGPLPCPALQPAPCISDPLSQHSTVRGLRAQTGGACPLPHPQSMPIPLGSQRTSGRAGAGCSDSLLPSQTPQVLHHRRAAGRFQARPSKPTPEPFLNANPHRARTPAAGVQAPGRRCSQTARGIAGPEFRVSGPCTASLSLAQGGPAGIRT